MEREGKNAFIILRKMTTKPLPLIILSLIIFTMMSPQQVSAQSINQKYGVFEGHSDIGNVEQPGNMTYNAEKQEYTIEGSGSNIWFGSDEFQFAWKKIKGDFILTCTGRICRKRS